ncbi:hypothetical protein [Ferroacidibacillus organovorans]|uniref:Uncharacterized protein n=1 Tax=Ferroacidibacillus organovorans TaxID=1765683 RepID=A0A853KA34_9BACL|nr:hypothetical protein [Ferroacidibacillus organovorans]KYP80374.1 hypothetical protein AYJ22_11455 [Ferroacidibacillus organovorans]OAG93321.1 hypothetical protein AYW79_11240 [Ferroacidibacillus organovorans]
MITSLSSQTGLGLVQGAASPNAHNKTTSTANSLQTAASQSDHDGDHGVEPSKGQHINQLG